MASKNDMVSVEELESELKKSLRQAAKGDTFSDVDEIRERVEEVRN